jgi:hypothetical protein
METRLQFVFFALLMPALVGEFIKWIAAYWALASRPAFELRIRRDNCCHRREASLMNGE